MNRLIYTLVGDRAVLTSFTEDRATPNARILFPGAERITLAGATFPMTDGEIAVCLKDAPDGLIRPNFRIGGKTVAGTPLAKWGGVLEPTPSPREEIGALCRALSEQTELLRALREGIDGMKERLDHTSIF